MIFIFTNYQDIFEFIKNSWSRDVEVKQFVQDCKQRVFAYNDISQVKKLAWLEISLFEEYDEESTGIDENFNNFLKTLLRLNKVAQFENLLRSKLELESSYSLSYENIGNIVKATIRLETYKILRTLDSERNFIAKLENVIKVLVNIYDSRPEKKPLLPNECITFKLTAFFSLTGARLLTKYFYPQTALVKFPSIFAKVALSVGLFFQVPMLCVIFYLLYSSSYCVCEKYYFSGKEASTAVRQNTLSTSAAVIETQPLLSSMHSGFTSNEEEIIVMMGLNFLLEEERQYPGRLSTLMCMDRACIAKSISSFKRLISCASHACAGESCSVCWGALNSVFGINLMAYICL